jgi:hypothetical protein
MEDGIMAEQDLSQRRKQTGPFVVKDKEVDNVKRILTMLEKALERILRRSYYNRDQYPRIAFEIEEQMKVLRGWIQDYELYSPLPSFRSQVGLAMKDLGACRREQFSASRMYDKIYMQLEGANKLLAGGKSDGLQI